MRSQVLTLTLPGIGCVPASPWLNLHGFRWEEQKGRQSHDWLSPIIAALCLPSSMDRGLLTQELLSTDTKYCDVCPY